MKIATLIALLGSAACVNVESTIALDQASKSDGDDGDDNKDENEMSQLITSALAGAKPGIINTPRHKGSDKEMDKTVTKGKAKNYKFHW